jgi:hypothetical protein
VNKVCWGIGWEIGTGQPVLENPGSSKKCWGIRWGEASTQLIPQTFLPLCGGTYSSVLIDFLLAEQLGYR